MNNDFNINKKIYDAFQGIFFYDKTHKYIYGSKVLASSTGFIKKFSEEFDKSYWLPYSTLRKMGHAVRPIDKINHIIEVDGLEYKISELYDNFDMRKQEKELQAKWDEKRDIATYKGGQVHYFIECWYQNKLHKPNGNDSHSDLIFEDIKVNYEINRKQFMQFYNATRKFLIPIRSELIIFDKDSLIGGMIDQLFYDTRIDKYVIYDWKTNSEFSTHNRYNTLKFPFNFLDESSLSKYSLQLNLYQYIFEKGVGIKLGPSQLILFDSNKSSYVQYNIIDLQKEFKNHVFSSNQKLKTEN
jgi:hypothetical protein